MWLSKLASTKGTKPHRHADRCLSKCYVTDFTIVQSSAHFSDGRGRRHTFSLSLRSTMVKPAKQGFAWIQTRADPVWSRILRDGAILECDGRWGCCKAPQFNLQASTDKNPRFLCAGPQEFKRGIHVVPSKHLAHLLREGGGGGD